VFALTFWSIDEAFYCARYHLAIIGWAMQHHVQHAPGCEERRCVTCMAA